MMIEQRLMTVYYSNFNKGTLIALSETSEFGIGFGEDTRSPLSSFTVLSMMVTLLDLI